MVRNGVLANWGKGLIGKYLACDYPTGHSICTHVLTVLFPHNATHRKADFSRAANGRAIVRQGEIEDCVFESAGEKLVEIKAGISAQARGRCHQALDGFRDGESLVDGCGSVCFGWV